MQGRLKMSIQPRIIDTAWELIIYALLWCVLYVTADEMDVTEYKAITMFVFVFKTINVLYQLIRSQQPLMNLNISSSSELSNAPAIHNADNRSATIATQQNSGSIENA